MLAADLLAGEGIGKAKGLQPEYSISKLVTFVTNNLETFAEKYAGSTTLNEDGLNQKLDLLLNRNARLGDYPFQFKKEFMEDTEKGNSPKVDFGVVSYPEGIYLDAKWYGNNESFFSMECKRLYGTKGAREKEYLVGRWKNDKYIDCGGVERFKKGIHGRGVQYGALIGYVQASDFDYWLGAINSWIGELIQNFNLSTCQWWNDDKLVERGRTASTATLESKNAREDGSGSVKLFHLWVNLVQTQ